MMSLHAWLFMLFVHVCHFMLICALWALHAELCMLMLSVHAWLFVLYVHVCHFMLGCALWALHAELCMLGYLYTSVDVVCACMLVVQYVRVCHFMLGCEFWALHAGLFVYLLGMLACECCWAK
jgi:hypothetical protein